MLYESRLSLLKLTLFFTFCVKGLGRLKGRGLQESNYLKSTYRQGGIVNGDNLLLRLTALLSQYDNKDVLPGQ